MPIATDKVGRKQADDVCYQPLRAEEVACWRAYLFWVGVRIGGGSHYSIR